ncbi:MAG: plastocyanin/azurin family copper-binding protein [Bacteroidota bacterium]
MKRTITTLITFMALVLTVNAQDKMMKGEMVDKNVQTISLEQIPGAFTQKEISVSEGTYVFQIKNNGVDHNVGFVLVEKGKDISKPENHIQTAYVTAPVATDETQLSKPTALVKGEYIYFCPLNPTATDNILIVE